MKIIIITDQYPPLEYGGMSQHAYHMSKYLSEKNDVMVILPKTYKDKIRESKYLIKTVLTLKYQKYDEYILLKIARAFEPQVIHVCTAGMVYYKISKIYPVVLRVVGNDFLRPWRGKSIILGTILFRIPNKYIYNYLIRKQLKKRKKNVLKQMKHCSKVVANSEWTRQRLIENKIEEDKIDIIVGGYDQNLFLPARNKNDIREKLGIDKEKKIVVTAANLVRKKGIDTVIKAVAVLARFYDIEYYIIGDGEELYNLKNLAKKIEIEQRIHFEGRKKQKELSEYYQSADMYVQVSRNQALDNGGVDVETMGRTYFEAGACGIPVIASRLGGIPSVIEHNINGLLIDNVEDVNELVELMKIVFNDHATSKRISKGAIKISREQFSWEKVVFKFESIFNDVIAGR